MESYESKLSWVVDWLGQNKINAQVRGDGAASFVYAETGTRAIELSWDGSGVFIEMFEQPEEASVRDELQDTYEAGAEAALEWLSNGN